MSTIATTLAKYRAYHLDRRNVATHALGVPMIVLAVEILLSRPQMAFAGATISPAMVFSALSAVYYLRLDLRFGLVLTAILAAFAAIGLWIGAQSTRVWLTAGIGLFVIGWAFQVVGHKYEGRKPAFIDDLESLMVGPLFMLAELAFALGLRRDLHDEVVRAA
ncbi:Mpo1 family 2-hydroxy fatty acid dioxygenase [Aurantiacibacter spongiae]|uniref:DUF962 domain-containing protein n=1 Tax=Aurantiacibacter spongiae TaxID=2488860 RepID=A0A3N5DG13_9SPHN|nr:Mpo1-like protein [Aurantiacibacter spongiae]RPF70612.1 DUF962 domain-containing protein [Aurantiacibacter spongiae]